MVSSKLATPLSIQGEVIYPDDSGFDPIANIWDGRHLQRPSLIARCLSAGDVAKSVRYACDNGLEISVRSGGHNPNGYATNDVASSWTSDSSTTSTSTTPGIGADRGWLISGDLVKEAGKFGLAAVTGMLSSGLDGLRAQWGRLACSPQIWFQPVDNILGAILVTAIGDVIYCSDDERPEWFWRLEVRAQLGFRHRGRGPALRATEEDARRIHYLGPLGQANVAGLLTSLLDALNEMADHIYPNVFVVVDENRAPSVTLFMGHPRQPNDPKDIVERDIAGLGGLGGTVSFVRVRSYDELLVFNLEVAIFEDGFSNFWIDREIGMPKLVSAERLQAIWTKLLVNRKRAPSNLEIEGMPFGNPKRKPARHRDAMAVLALAEWSGAAPGSEKYPELARELDAALLRAGVTTSGFGLLNNNSEVTAEMVAEVYKPEVYCRLAAVNLQSA
uniref:6-hydroxy-D-nicotine oxidase n=2 Tax=Pseudarthrobacter oxydans TaxID=1671 RepID=P70749_PSEOX|nr:6-hydroxy-D-nicotine oxidase [Pseudarthrobacter oxydans]